MALTYYINRKKVTSVISFTGLFDEGESTKTLQQCFDTLKADPAKYQILNLAGATGFEHGAARPFILFQNKLRASSKLFICATPDKILWEMRKQGLIREEEVQADLMVVLQAIVKLEAAAAAAAG